MGVYEHLIPQSGFVIGEIACGHEGDLKKMKQLIDVVAQAGAPAVKFQVFIPPERVTPDHPEWQIFHDLALPEKDWQEAARYARGQGLMIFADVFGADSLAMARALDVDGFKIHSEDLLNTAFIARVAREGKVLIIGVGGAHRMEVYQLLKYLRGEGLLNQVVLMTGVQTFPTPLEAHSLEEVRDLIAKYGPWGVKVGFSDHVSGDVPEAKVLPLMALACGAAVIEKHVTVDRAQKWEDYQSALDQKDFTAFMKDVRAMAPLLAPVGGINAFERRYRKQFKKSPTAARDMVPGTVVSLEDVAFQKRADASLPLSTLGIAGRAVKAGVKAGELIHASQLNHKVGGIIVARCSSNRLPSKATRRILERETIALLIERIRRCRNLDCVILATSTDPSDDVLETIARREGVLPFRGSLENLSLRFYEAAQHYGVSQIVRITGDDILRDEVMIDRAVESHLQNSCEVTFMRDMPYGTSSEVFSLAALETILNTVDVPENTEYLEWFLQNDRYFSINEVASGYVFDPAFRLTLDYDEDFTFFTRIFEHFYPRNPDFKMSEILAWLTEHPEVVAINRHKTAKYTSKDLNVTLRI